MNLSKQYDESDLKLDMASLIDVVFLLLIYFMVTASLIKKEADINFILPANVAVENMTDIPVEVIVEILEDGTIQVEGLRFAPEDSSLDELVTQVAGLKEIARSQNSPFFVNLAPYKQARHKRVIDVMDACHAAGVKELTFSAAR